MSDQNNSDQPRQAPKRGRPMTGEAKTNAQRQAEYRLRRASEKRQAHRAMRRLSDDDVLAKFVERLRADDEVGAQDCWIEIGLRRGWKLF